MCVRTASKPELTQAGRFTYQPGHDWPHLRLVRERVPPICSTASKETVERFTLASMSPCADAKQEGELSYRSGTPRSPTTCPEERRKERRAVTSEYSSSTNEGRNAATRRSSRSAEREGRIAHFDRPPRPHVPQSHLSPLRAAPIHQSLLLPWASFAMLISSSTVSLQPSVEFASAKFMAQVTRRWSM